MERDKGKQHRALLHGGLQHAKVRASESLQSSKGLQFQQSQSIRRGNIAAASVPADEEERA